MNPQWMIFMPSGPNSSLHLLRCSRRMVSWRSLRSPRLAKVAHGGGSAAGLPSEGLFPVVDRRPIGVLPSQHPAGHPRRRSGVGLAARAAWCRPFPRRLGPGAKQGAPRGGHHIPGLISLAQFRHILLNPPVQEVV